MAAMSGIDWDAALAPRASVMHASEIRELLKLLDQPGIISFAGGIPDPDLFPQEDIRAAYVDLLTDQAKAAQTLQYSISEGYPPLRRWIASDMAARGVPCEIDNIVITSGSQQGLDFLGKLFLGANDTALVTAPTYLGALQAFNPYEPRYDRLDDAANGTPAGAYRARAEAAGGRVAMAYVVPDFSNPTGETLDLAARHRLVDLAHALGIVLVEDAAYQALRYEGVPLPSCLSLDVQRSGHMDQARTAYCGTFSKTIAPGLRIGWICAARDLVQKIVLAKQAADLHSPTLNQMVMARVLECGYAAQVSKITRAYAKRRDAMLAALGRHMPWGTRWTTPQGGMFIWVTLPPGIDGAVLLAEALHLEGVAFVPGSAFFFDGSGRNTIRLNFSLQSEAIMDEGLYRLGRLIRRQSQAGCQDGFAGQGR